MAERTDGTDWLHTNDNWANPVHIPFTAGVPMPVPGDDSMSGFAAADINCDGYADLFGMAGWMNLNRTPAGNPRPFLDSFRDRKSTRLNSSHANISYAVFCLKKKKIMSNIKRLYIICSYESIR